MAQPINIFTAGVYEVNFVFQLASQLSADAESFVPAQYHRPGQGNTARMAGKGGGQGNTARVTSAGQGNIARMASQGGGQGNTPRMVRQGNTVRMAGQSGGSGGGGPPLNPSQLNQLPRYMTSCYPFVQGDPGTQPNGTATTGTSR